MLTFRHATVGTSALNTVHSSSRLLLPSIKAALHPAAMWRHRYNADGLTLPVIGPTANSDVADPGTSASTSGSRSRLRQSEPVQQPDLVTRRPRANVVEWPCSRAVFPLFHDRVRQLRVGTTERGAHAGQIREGSPTPDRNDHFTAFSSRRRASRRGSDGLPNTSFAHSTMVSHVALWSQGRQHGGAVSARSMAGRCSSGACR
jgi:hypothetical protein